MQLDEDQKQELKKALTETSDSLNRVAAERDLMKNIKTDTCESLGIDKKIFGKLAKAFHKQNLDAEKIELSEVEALYDEVIS